MCECRAAPDSPPPWRRSATTILGLALAAALTIGACDGGSGDGTSNDGTSGVATSSSATIPQPRLGKLNSLTRRRLAPKSSRVDLAIPSFSAATAVTNPLFPISELHSSVLLGEVEGDPLKVEVTLLPETRIVEWRGQRIETLQSQFAAYLNGRIHEVALDLYAQADDGAVWYFGEYVFNYEHGVVADTEGTWHAGAQYPPAMIMPADPKVGDVYRTENIPGVAFEEVTVKTVGKTVEGPTGPVAGAMVGQELHLDERALEDKTFAPGYGEFFSGSRRDFEANALTVPVDAASGPEPAELRALSRNADDAFAAARSKNWKAASRAAGGMTTGWDAVEAGMPERLATRMIDALDALDRAVGARNRLQASLAALDVAQASLDLELRYRPPAEVDLARLDLWARQLVTDAGAEHAAAVRGDVTTLEWIRDRIAIAGADANRIDDELRHLEAAAEADEFSDVVDATRQLREALSGLS